MIKTKKTREIEPETEKEMENKRREWIQKREWKRGEKRNITGERKKEDNKT